MTSRAERESAVDEPRISIEIDRELCMGSGVCVVYAARTFEIDDDTKSTVVDVSGDPLEQIRSAASGCPTGAITVTVSGADAE
jgi:ferredoxin